MREREREKERERERERESICVNLTSIATSKLFVCSHISLWDGKDGTCLKANVTLGAGGDKHCGIKVCYCISVNVTLCYIVFS